MDKPLSIIVPAYNVESTLDDCLSSIVSQSFADWELWLVDDGSTDRTTVLCDHWAAKDKRISVLHQSNKGLSGARNSGLEHAQGLYVTFVDADDKLAPDTLIRLMEQLTGHPDYDILEYSFQKTWQDGKHEDFMLPDKVYTSVTDYWLDGQAYLHTYACNKMFRTSLFADVRFPVGVLFEDVLTLSLLLEKATTIATTSCGLYHYFQNPKGITQTADVNLWRMLLNNHLHMLRRLLAEPTINDKHRQQLSTYYMHLLNTQMIVAGYTGEDPVLPHYKVSFGGCITPQSKVKFFLLKAIGLKNLCRLYRLFLKCTGT